MPKKTTTTPDRELRVWIELPKPADKEHAEQLCGLANNMLKRLEKPHEGPAERGFFWSEHEKRYCYGGAMGYTVLSDGGQWFNLEYLGRPLEEPYAQCDRKHDGPRCADPACYLGAS